MGTVLPDAYLEQIQFCEDHLAPFTLNAAAIGLTGPQVSNLGALTVKARAAYNAAQAARLASKAATLTFHTDTGDMRDNIRDLIALIKTKAETTNNPNVYALAQISAPSPATPASPPGQPSNFIITLETDGSLTLTWKCKNSTTSTGVFFQVQRKLAGETNLRNIGGTPVKSFNDATVPAGIGSLVYLVTGFRGTRAGDASDQITVQFGVGGGGLSVVGATLKMAA